MLTITIPGREQWNEVKEEFTVTKDTTINLEHSLVSISKWETKYKIPFLDHQMNQEEELEYIKCMTIDKNVDDNIYYNLSAENRKEISEYISDNKTATTFNNTENGGSKSAEYVTSETIYYWMIANNIPKEFERWHLSRLIALIKMCNIKNQPQKMMSRNETVDMYARLNAERRMKYNSKG